MPDGLLSHHRHRDRIRLFGINSSLLKPTIDAKITNTAKNTVDDIEGVEIPLISSIISPAPAVMSTHTSTFTSASASASASASTLTSFPLLSLLFWLLTTLVLLLYLPTAIAPDLYISCSYSYDHTTRFDNTILTWGTDYLLVFWMGLFIARLQGYRSPHRTELNTLITETQLLLFCYLLSVLFGGMCHQRFTSVPSDLNNWMFRILWTCCVGSVSLAGGFIGRVSLALHNTLPPQAIKITQQDYPFLPKQLPKKSWTLYGFVMVLTSALGGLSMCRPACDIFLAGCSHTVPFFFLIIEGGRTLMVQNTVALDSFDDDGTNGNIQGNGGNKRGAKRHRHRHRHRHGKSPPKWVRYLLIYGSLGNAPLLWVYPVMARIPGLTLGFINAVLHTNLALAWGAQAYAIERHVKMSL